MATDVDAFCLFAEKFIRFLKDFFDQCHSKFYVIDILVEVQTTTFPLITLTGNLLQS